MMHIGKLISAIIAVTLSCTFSMAQENVLFSGHNSMEAKQFSPSAKLPDVTLPAYVDNSKNKYFPPIIDQNGGSCAQASGIGYMFTYEMNRLLDRDASASKANQFSYQYSWNFVNDGIDQGSFVDDGLRLAQLYGMMTLEDYGTSSVYEFKWASGYDKYFNAMHYRVKEIYTFQDSIPLMKRYLYDAGDGSSAGGIITFSTQSTNWTIDDYYDGPSNTGYKSLLTGLGNDGAHALTIAGYDDAVEYTDESGNVHKGAFIVVNSWGTYSHDEGRFYLPYDFFRDPDVSNIILSNEVVGVSVCTYEPEVVFKMTLEYSSRDDLYFGVGGQTDPYAKSAKQFYYDTGAFSQQGGDFPMRGQYSTEPIEIAIDATRCMQSDSPEYKKFFIKVVRGMKGSKKGSGRVLAVSLIDYRSGEAVERKCTSSFPVDLVDGDNVFAVNLVDAKMSASPYRYKDKSGNVSTNAFLLKTAKGKGAKIRFDSGGSGAITITYEKEKD